MNDSHFISKTVTLALKGKYNTKPGVNVGCVIVKKTKLSDKVFMKSMVALTLKSMQSMMSKVNTKHPISPNSLEAKYISLLSLAVKKAKPVPA